MLYVNQAGFCSGSNSIPYSVNYWRWEILMNCFSKNIWQGKKWLMLCLYGTFYTCIMIPFSGNQVKFWWISSTLSNSPKFSTIKNLHYTVCLLPAGYQWLPCLIGKMCEGYQVTWLPDITAEEIYTIHP